LFDLAADLTNTRHPRPYLASKLAARSRRSGQVID